MSKILTTHVAKGGDAIWAMATVKALAESLGGKVDFATSPYNRGLLPILARQPYIDSAFVLEDWSVRFDAPAQPAIPPGVGAWRKAYPFQFHLSMREWPAPTCAEYYPLLLKKEYGINLDVKFTEPWLEVPTAPALDATVLSFSDEWVELKVGWIIALCVAFPNEQFLLVTHKDARLWKEFRFPFLNLNTNVTDIQGLAWYMAKAKLVVTCNSLGHPLASALGKTCVVAEPAPARHHPCFKAPLASSKNSYFDGINANELVELVKGRLT